LYNTTDDPYETKNIAEQNPQKVEELKKEGVTIVDKIETFDYGKFVHISFFRKNQLLPRY